MLAPPFTSFVALGEVFSHFSASEPPGDIRIKNKNPYVIIVNIK